MVALIYQLKRALIVYTPIDRETRISPIGFITQNEDETNPNRQKDTPRRPSLKSIVLSFFNYLYTFAILKKAVLDQPFNRDIFGSF